MRPAAVLVLCCSVLLGSGGAAAAQSPSPDVVSSSPPFDIPALSLDQERDLTTWLSAMEKWQAYDLKWQNRPARDGWARIVDRQPVPAAPAWLDDECGVRRTAHVLDLDQRIGDACRLLDDPRARLGGGHAAVLAARVASEKPAAHSSFLSRMHIDGLWTTAATTGRIYGLVGSHFSLVDVGRIQIFGPPGVLLLSVPSAGGSRQVTIGYTWGVSVRLTEMRVFGQRDMTLFLNVSKVWVNARSETPNAQGFEAIGFSLAPRKKHQ